MPNLGILSLSRYARQAYLQNIVLLQYGTLPSSPFRTRALLGVVTHPEDVGMRGALVLVEGGLHFSKLPADRHLRKFW